MTVRAFLLSPVRLVAAAFGLATGNASKSRPTKERTSDERLRRLAEEVGKDPATAEWVRSARVAAAAGALERPLDADELRARIAGLRAGGR